MYRFTYLLAFIFITLSFNVNSQIINKNFFDNDYKVDKSRVDQLFISNIDNKSDHSQAVTFREIRVCIGYASSSLYSRTTPFIYEPNTNLLLLTGLKWQYGGDGEESQIIGEVYYSANMGQTWDSLKAFNEDEMGIVNLSLAINNYNDASNINDLPFTILGRFAPKYNEWRTTGMAFVFKDGTDYLPDLTESPSDNNPGSQYQWQTMKLKSTGDSPYSYAATMLSTPMETQVQYGAYGLLATDHESQTSIISKVMTSEWGVDLFREPGQLNTTYNTNIEIELDASGNIYAAVNNIFRDDEENRVIAVSKSTDGGATWSDFNRMPTSLLTQYIESTIFTNVFPYEPHSTMNAFLVLGEDSYCYYYPMVIANEDSAEIHLVEAKYSGGIWSLTKVTDLNGLIPNVFYASELDQGDNTLWLYYKAPLGPLGYEIQASLTADGNDIILKYIDLGLTQSGEAKIVEFATPVPVTELDDQNEEQQVNMESIGIYDIFVATREVSGGNWSVFNVTDDDRNYKGTWIPNIVPSKQNIPVVYPATAQYADQSEPFNQLPQAMRDRIVAFPFWYTVGTITSVGVNENPENYEFNVFNVYPNPVSGLAEFAFELDKAQNVTIELYNSLGQKVKEIYNGFTPQGLHGINSDLSEFSNGVYYYTLTTETNKISKVLNVVK